MIFRPIRSCTCSRRAHIAAAATTLGALALGSTACVAQEPTPAPAPAPVPAAVSSAPTPPAGANPSLPIAAQMAPPAQSTVSTNLIVAADGSAPYKTVQDAISAAAAGTEKHPVIIHVKPGTYKELLYVQREKRFVRLVGDTDDPAKVVISYGLFANMSGVDGKPIGTFRTPSVFIDADDFSAENVTFDNSAGPVGQALAIRLDGDRIAFRNCRFTGWQDTILDNRGRHYYDHCAVTGSVDFIFGAGTALFDHCDITEIRDKGGDITAPSTPQDQPYGLVFLNCNLSATSDVKPGVTGLMRPWRPYGESVFINCTMTSAYKPTGWDAWSGREVTCRAYEFGSVDPSGKPVDTSQRSAWSKVISDKDAKGYTVKAIFGDWDPHKAL